MELGEALGERAQPLAELIVGEVRCHLLDLLDSGLERSAESTEAIAQKLLESKRPEQHDLGARLRNLGVYRWPVWSALC